MNLVSYALKAENPLQNVARFYKIEAGTDLFGDWYVCACYGRQGTSGQRKTWGCGSQQDALRKVQALLQKRRSSPKRIGCAYHLLDAQIHPSLIEGKGLSHL